MHPYGVPYPGAASRRRRGAGVAALVLCLLLGGAACSDDEDNDSEPSPTPSAASSSPPPVKTTVKIAKVTGQLPAKRRASVKASAGRAVDRWFQAAYLGGEYPRRPGTFADAFPGFTGDAKALARRHLGVMSNADISRKVDAVTARGRAVGLDILAMDKHTRGVTARVRLVFDTSGELTRRYLVTGQLNLVSTKGGWRVFAFDVKKRPVRPKQDQPKQDQPKQDKQGRQDEKNQGADKG